MRVKCINDSFKPSDFPQSKWIKKGEEYTVTRVDKLDNGEYGFQLEGIDTESEPLYKYFSASRFVPIDEDDGGFEEAMKELSEELQTVA